MGLKLELEQNLLEGVLRKTLALPVSYGAGLTPVLIQ